MLMAVDQKDTALIIIKFLSVTKEPVANTVEWKTLVGENINKLLADCQNFFPQLCLISIQLPLLGHSPNFSPSKV